MGAREEKKKEKRMRIIAAAARAFSEKGYANTNMSEVARGAEVGKGTLYEYFDSKESLFFAVFEWHLRGMIDQLEEMVGNAGGSASDRIRSLCDAILQAGMDMFEYYPLTLEFWVAAGISSFRDRFKRMFLDAYARFRSVVADIIKEGIASGEFRKDVDPEAMASSVVGAWDAFFLQAWFDKEFDPLDVGTKFFEVFIRGIAE